MMQAVLQVNVQKKNFISIRCSFLNQDIREFFHNASRHARGYPEEKGYANVNA